MSYIYVERRRTNQYGKATETGIHLKKPNGSELADAIERGLAAGYKSIFVYDSARDLRAIAESLEASGIMIGWSQFCTTVDAFKLDTLAPNPFSTRGV